MYLLWIIGGILGLYAVTTGILLLLIRLKKEPDGTPILDTQSWHFKMAYPYRRHSGLFMRDLRQGYAKISICRYFIKLFVMIWIVWPILGLSSVLLTLFTFMFGYYGTPDFENPEGLGRFRQYWLPRIKGVRILPAYILLPIGYTLSFCFFPSYTSKVTCLCLDFLFWIFVVCFFFWFINWVQGTGQKNVSLVREYVKAKKRGWCPFFKVVGTTEPPEPEVPVQDNPSRPDDDENEPPPPPFVDKILD